MQLWNNSWKGASGCGSTEPGRAQPRSLRSASTLIHDTQKINTRLWARSERESVSPAPDSYMSYWQRYASPLHFGSNLLHPHSILALIYKLKEGDSLRQRVFYYLLSLHCPLPLSYACAIERSTAVTLNPWLASDRFVSTQPWTLHTETEPDQYSTAAVVTVNSEVDGSTPVLPAEILVCLHNSAKSGLWRGKQNTKKMCDKATQPNFCVKNSLGWILTSHTIKGQLCTQYI